MDVAEEHKKKDNLMCGVAEELFPRRGKCCVATGALAGARYREVCPDCAVWTSFPDGGSLEVATMFACCRFGYSKRIKE